MRFSTRRFGIFAVACSFALSASATQVALVGDTHVNASRTSTNFGSLANLYVGNGNTALLQFDLSSLPAGVTPAQISRATLTLFVNRVNASGPVALAAAAGPWSESSVTFASQPSAGSTVGSFTPLQAGQYITVDITALVQSWITNPSSNNGIVLSSSTANVLFDSKENDQTGHPAGLDITLTSMGATGATGAQGLPGLPGATGAQGLPGLPGATGTQGLAGAAGIAGATGAVGATGANGITGATGSVGTTGATGTAGATGATGIAGVNGATGATGATGQQGIQGATGATGAAAGGMYNISLVYVPGSVVTYNGQSYLSVNQNQGITPDSDPTSWVLVSGGAGSQGVTGATGATGGIGPQGLPGLQGVTGSTGTTGATGMAGVTGAMGQQGVQGATGTTGSTGATGAIGTTGAVGTPGATGATGIAGATGVTGLIGSTGATGYTGVTGATGIAGTTGATGAMGSTGITYMGAYSNATTYAVTAVVLYNGNLYYDSLPGITPTGTPPTNTTYWSLLLPKGATGATGSAGNDGAPGSTGVTGATGPAGSGSGPAYSVADTVANNNSGGSGTYFLTGSGTNTTESGGHRILPATYTNIKFVAALTGTASSFFTLSLRLGMPSSGGYTYSDIPNSSMTIGNGIPQTISLSGLTLPVGSTIAVEVVGTQSFAAAGQGLFATVTAY